MLNKFPGISLLGSRIGSRAGAGHTPMQPQTQSSVSLEKFAVSIDPLDLTPELIKCSGEVRGLIWDRHFAKGQTKLVHDVCLHTLLIPWLALMCSCPDDYLL